MKSTGIIKIAIIFIFMFPCIATADDWKNESGKGPPGNPGFSQDGPDYWRGRDDRGSGPPGFHKGDRGYERHRDDRRSGHYRKPWDYHEYRGYRERPYDKGRHYGPYKHKGYRYEYHGHWRSWDEWDRYVKRHPNVYKRGRYYRDHNHLMFRFCEPVDGVCFFFSIGR